MTQVWRKTSQCFLIGLGTLSLLVVVTGMGVEMPKKDLLSLRTSALAPALPEPVCGKSGDRTRLFRTWEDLLKPGFLGSALCTEMQESHYQRSRDDEERKSILQGT